ncbi:MAG: hypothetical protein AB7O04_15970 [Hyphomonadaceae bacterium]
MGGIETHCESLYPLLAKLEDSIEIVVIGRQGYVQPGVYRGVSVRTNWTPPQP